MCLYCGYSVDILSWDLLCSLGSRTCWSRRQSGESGCQEAVGRAILWAAPSLAVACVRPRDAASARWMKRALCSGALSHKACTRIFLDQTNGGGAAQKAFRVMVWLGQYECVKRKKGVAVGLPKFRQQLCECSTEKGERHQNYLPPVRRQGKDGHIMKKLVAVLNCYLHRAGIWPQGSRERNGRETSARKRCGTKGAR